MNLILLCVFFATVSCTTQNHLQTQIRKLTNQVDALVKQQHRWLQDHSGHDHGDHSPPADMPSEDSEAVIEDSEAAIEDSATAIEDPQAANEDPHAGHHMGGGDSKKVDHSQHGGGHGVIFTQSRYTTVLFSGWDTTNIGEYILSCLFTFALGVLIEYLATVRLGYGKAQGFGFQGNSTELAKSGEPSMRSHAIRSVLYLIGVSLSYMLMLVRVFLID